MNKIIMGIGTLALLGGTGYGVLAFTESQKQAKLDALAPTVQSSGGTYSLNDVAAHKSTTDCWIAINGKVYDATKYIASGMHNPEIEKGCGKDASDMYARERKHQGNTEAQDIMAKLYIGDLAL